ncbi:hypothetical protein GCM10028822_23500 [Hymenobacter terrigena]
MTSSGLLLRVATTWPLPGLGLLALPDGLTPLLLPYALHTALAITALLPDGTHQSGTATVEEVSRPDDAAGPVRGLLLDMSTTSPLPPGTEIWLTGTSATELQ